MSKMTIVQSAEISLWFHPGSRIVHHQIHRYPGAALLEATLEKGLQTMQQYRASKWLSDDRKSGALPPSHHEWAAKDWGPRAAAAGWKFWALIPPAELIGQMNMARIEQIYESLRVTVKVFDGTAAALTWLTKC